MRRLVAPVVVALLALGCQPARTEWKDIAASPEATEFEGALAADLLTRLNSRLLERHLQVLGSRLEYLPAGVDWQAHLSWRDGHANGMHQLGERIPEPDAPVLSAEYTASGRTLFVIGHADDDRRRLVVLTALASRQ